MRAARFFLIVAFAALLFCPANALLYELCDSASMDRSTKTLECLITEPIYRFNQGSIDNFWLSLKADGNYTKGNIETVHWVIAATVVNVIEDVAFVEGEGFNIPWDMTLKGDINLTYDLPDINAGTWIWTVTKPTVTAIRVTKDGRKPAILFSPKDGRRTIRNLTLLNPSGSDTYIEADRVKPMEIDIEGDLIMAGSFIENAATVKATNILLSNDAKLSYIGKIEASNLSLNNRSAVDSIGALGIKAIELKNSLTGLQLDNDSSIDGLLGSISVDGDIKLNGNSRIKTIEAGLQKTIETIEAKNLTLNDASEIVGVGGPRGAIVLQGLLSLSQGSLINAREENAIKKIEADSIVLGKNSFIQNIDGILKITGVKEFKLSDGAKIISLDGNIESCAPISMDGNETTILFSDANKEIRAPSVDVNNGARIVCLSATDGCYNFLKQECGSTPQTELDTNSTGQGAAPLSVQFDGSCAAPAGLDSCKINYGDGNEEQFIGSASHIYFESGTYSATLTATDDENKTAVTTKTISVTASGGNGQPIQALVTVEITVLPQVVQQGNEAYVEISLNAAAETFSLTNNAGLPAVTSVPTAFPAKAGPFQTSAIMPGAYSFTVSGTTKDGRVFSAQAAFEILKKEGGFAVDPFIPLLVVFIIVLLVIVLLARKLVKEGKLGAKKTMLPPGEKPKEGAGKWAWKGPTEEKPQAAQPTTPPAAPPAQPKAPPTAPPQTPTAPGELPPWLQGEEEEEEGNGTS